jgi:hypothetical protein
MNKIQQAHQDEITILEGWLKEVTNKRGFYGTQQDIIFVLSNSATSFANYEESPKLDLCLDEADEIYILEKMIRVRQGWILKINELDRKLT